MGNKIYFCPLPEIGSNSNGCKPDWGNLQINAKKLNFCLQQKVEKSELKKKKKLGTLRADTANQQVRCRLKLIGRASLVSSFTAEFCKTFAMNVLGNS